MLREAAGIGFDDMVTLAFAYWAYLQSRGRDDPIRVKAMVAPSMTIAAAEVQTFLDLFCLDARRPGSGAAPVPSAVADAADPGPAAAAPRMTTWSCSTSGTWSSG